MGGKHGPPATEHGSNIESMGMPTWLRWDVVWLHGSVWHAYVAGLDIEAADFGCFACSQGDKLAG